MGDRFSCPECQCVWGFDEIQFQECHCCGWPNACVEDEDDWMDEDDDYCDSCGGAKGTHLQNCPDDRSPFAELIRNGYD